MQCSSNTYKNFLSLIQILLHPQYNLKKAKIVIKITYPYLTPPHREKNLAISQHPIKSLLNRGIIKSQLYVIKCKFQLVVKNHVRKSCTIKMGWYKFKIRSTHFPTDGPM